MTKKFIKIIALTLVISAGLVASQVSADHTWGNYHWARTSNPFNIQLGDNMTSSWDPYLALASTDWSLSSVLDTTVVRGLSNPKNCKPVAGRVEICNSRYGNNGWLGIASIWASGSHITQGTVKMNDTYFNTATYNKPEWKRFVMCQEIGHAFGLDHQDEDFGNANMNTCMDYTNNPLSNQLPNQHDYDMLETIYGHLDTASTISGNPTSGKGNGKGNGNGNVNENIEDIDHNDKSTWGKSIRTSKDGKASLYVKDTKDGQVFTFVIWAE